MSLDKKAILKDIEVLIRSIKVHYDNIENEHRIPTIELELITSKIRKLHEKSIVYNHLHYLEEEQIQSARRLKLDQLIFKHNSDEKIEQTNTEAISSKLYDAQLKFEEKVTSMQKAQEEKEPVSENNPTIDADKDLVNEEASNFLKKDTNLAQETNFKPIQLGSKIGINDRFRFIKNLFGGNGMAMEEALKEIEQCQSAQALNDCITQLKKKNHWHEEDETVIDFMSLVK
jgi:hypothetical protein